MEDTILDYLFDYFTIVLNHGGILHLKHIMKADITSAYQKYKVNKQIKELE